MNEQELQAHLLALYPRENERCDWKAYTSLKNTFASHEGEDIISYVSGLANCEGGQLVIGLEDGTGAVRGIRETAGHTPENMPYRIVGKCSNVNSEGLWVEEFITTDTSQRVWVVHIPRHLPRQPVLAHRKKWQRLGDSLVLLTPEREAAILREPLPLPDDWGRVRLPAATLDDLDPNALQLARQRFKTKHQHDQLGTECDGWPTTTFLNKAGLALDGVLTHATLLLVGRPEAVSLHLKMQPRLTWMLKNERGEDLDYRHFPAPLLPAVDALFGLVRNLRVRYIKDADTLFPDEVDQYDTYVVREALHNCLAHQDYASGRAQVYVVEFPDRLVFTNAGPFRPGSVEAVIRRDAPDPDAPVSFLSQAMVQLNMIDTVGSGIRRMFTKQSDKYFPLPDYELGHNQVKVTITGKVLDLAYARVLAQHPDLTLDEIILLDKLQKHQPLTLAEEAILRQRHLVEGRGQQLHISSGLAARTGQNVAYVKSRGYGNQHYEHMILEAVAMCEGGVSRTEINTLLYDQLPQSLLDDGARRRKINQLLSRLSRTGYLVNRGSRTKPLWFAGPAQAPAESAPPLRPGRSARLPQGRIRRENGGPAT